MNETNTADLSRSDLRRMRAELDVIDADFGNLDETTDRVIATLFAQFVAGDGPGSTSHKTRSNAYVNATPNTLGALRERDGDGGDGEGGDGEGSGSANRVVRRRSPSMSVHNRSTPADDREEIRSLAARAETFDSIDRSSPRAFARRQRT